jgi:hypothetical protein
MQISKYIKLAFVLSALSFSHLSYAYVWWFDHNPTEGSVPCGHGTDFISARDDCGLPGSSTYFNNSPTLFGETFAKYYATGANLGYFYLNYNGTMPVCDGVAFDIDTFNYPSGSCAVPPPNDCTTNQGDTIQLTGSGDYQTTLCSDGCGLTQTGSASYLPIIDTYFATYTYSGNTCSIANHDGDEVTTPIDECVYSNGLNLCTASDGSIEINGVNTSQVTQVPATACQYIKHGNFVCGEAVTTTPPMPDTGTPGNVASATLFSDGTDNFQVFTPEQINDSSFVPSGGTGGSTGEDGIFDRLGQLLGVNKDGFSGLNAGLNQLTEDETATLINGDTSSQFNAIGMDDFITSAGETVQPPIFELPSLTLGGGGGCLTQNGTLSGVPFEIDTCQAVEFIRNVLYWFFSMITIIYIFLYWSNLNRGQS